MEGARVNCFPPLANESSRVLILGSMPGAASLAAGEYYAHRQNAFWRIMADLLGVSREASYAARTQAVLGAGVALWDVMASCERAGSLDARIEPGSVVVNDFSLFFRTWPDIACVYFNGATAESCFRRHVLPGLASGPRQLVRLPSTSPAHAALSYADKLAAWRSILTR